MSKTQIKVSSLKSNPNNPRKINADKLKKLIVSIQDFPQMMELRPIVIDEKGYVLGGNMRLAALKQLGMTEIPDSWVKKASELSDEDKKRFIISDNASFGVWDWEKIYSEWEELPLGDWCLDLLKSDQSSHSSQFGLGDSDKPAFEEMHFVLSSEQAKVVKETMSHIQKSDEFKYTETFGNENKSGNTLYVMANAWKEKA